MQKNSLTEQLKKNKRWLLLWVVVCCAFLGAAGVLYKVYVKNAAAQPRSVMAVGKDSDRYDELAEDIVLQPGESLVQNITMVSPEITGIAVWTESQPKQTNVKVCLKNRDGEVLKEWTCDQTILPQQGFIHFYLPETKVEIGDVYSIEVQNTATSKADLGLKKVYTSFGAGLEENGETTHYSLFFQILDGDCGSIVYLYWFVVFLGILCFTVLLFLWKKRAKRNTGLICCIFLIGSIYLMIMPQYTVPDEGSHFLTAYSESSKILGRQAVDKENRVLLEKESADYLVREERPFSSAYAHYIRGLTGKDGAITEKTMATRSPLSGIHLGYVPQVLGISAGRLLGLNGLQIFFLGRLFALFWYCVVMAIALHVIPKFAKNILFLIGTFPMTMQMVVSYNYDSVLLGACFLLVSYLLYLAYDEKKEKITWKDAAAIGILLLVIVPIKFVYLPLLGLGLLIPREKFGGVWKKAVFGGGMAAAGVAAMLAARLPKILVAAGGTSAAGNTAQTYTLMACIKNPWHTFVVFFETIRQNLGTYFTGMIGDKLGWVEIEVSSLLIIAYIVLMVVCVTQDEKEKHLWKKWERVWMIFLFVITFGLVCTGLLLDYTPSFSGTILGIQGRYFLPIAMLLLLCLQNSVIVAKKNLDRAIEGSVVILQMLIALNVMITIMTR